MGKEKYYRILFVIAGVYDLFLGAVFCFFYKWLYENVLLRPLPEPPIYFQVCAAFIAMIGIGYFLVWKNLYRNVDLVKIGAGMKLVYILGALWYSTYATVPLALLIFGVLDVAFIIVFIEFLRYAKVSGKIPA